MKPELSQHLEEYQTKAKQFGEAGAPEQQLDQVLSSLRDFYAGEIAPQRDSSPEAQKKILDVQEQKRQLMRQLEQNLANLDNLEHRPENSENLDQVVFDHGQLIVQEGAGQNVKASLGEVITDLEWDRQYHLDPETVPRNIRKRYLIEQTKRQLHDLYDQQLIIDETSNSTTHKLKKSAYRGIAADRESGVEKTGVIAEKMVRLFLEKITLDRPDLEFNVVRADVRDDVEKKIDFVIHIKERFRGIKIQTNENKNDKGIQFTVNDAPENIAHKKSQIAWAKGHLDPSSRIKDIVLVSLPVGKFYGAYQSWKEQNQPTGGPDKLWGTATKKMIFDNIMKNVLPPEEIDQQWQVISNRGSGPEQKTKIAA